MRSSREFPQAGGTRRSDLSATLKPSQTEKERGRLTLVNIDLLLPPILPGLPLSALWWEIKGHVHTRALKQIKLPLCSFYVIVFPGDSNFRGYLTRLSPCSLYSWTPAPALLLWFVH